MLVPQNQSTFGVPGCAGSEMRGEAGMNRFVEIREILADSFLGGLFWKFQEFSMITNA